MAKKNIKKTVDYLTDQTDSEFRESFNESAPNALELENRLLGSLFLDEEIFGEVCQILESRHFFSKKNRIIFQAMLSLDSRKEPIDISTVKEEIKKLGQGSDVDAEYLINITESTVTSANSLKYAQVILEKFLLRNLIHTASEIVTKCLDPTVNTYTVLDEADKDFLDISATLNKKKIISVKDELNTILGELADRRAHKQVTGVPTGYDRLDDILGGFQKSELIIIAGRPSHGKTALSINIARNAAVKGKKKIAIFSLEMSFKELMYRMLSSEARVNGQKLKLGKSSTEEWSAVQSTFRNLETDLFIDDTSLMSITDIRAKARRLKKEHSIDMLVVDYLQLVRGPSDVERRELEVGYVSRGLKALAKELEIPVVACAQLNRSIEQRGKEKTPQLSDLRESGSIEQDADVVIFVNRPYMNLIGQLEKGTEEYFKKLHQADIIVGKNRNGPVDDMRLIFIPEYARFENMNKEFPITEIQNAVTDIKEDKPF
ncbi:MAG TPA: replicative DNA helicase [Ignavibacteria bacterium]|nr:replicative DNA helicase [Ignavibacteria bacterium]